MDADGGDIGIDGIGGNDGCGSFDCFGGIDGFGSGVGAFDAGAFGPHSGDAGDSRGHGVLHVKDAVVVRVGPHGVVDVKALFSRLALQAGMVAIGNYRLQLEPVDDLKFEILNKYGGKPRGDGKRMPGGWYPGATGWTRLWRQFWQIGSDPRGFRSGHPMRRFCETRTYLSVAGITWSYGEALDQQSLLALRLVSLPVHDPVQRWLVDSVSREKHHEVAHAIAERLYATLKDTEPCELSVINRRRISDRPPVENGKDPVDTPADGQPAVVRCSGADLANLIPGFGVPAKSGGQCPGFVLIVDPDAFPNPACQPGCGSSGTAGDAHQHGPGYGQSVPIDPRLEADHDPYFDGSPKDDADSSSGQGAPIPGYTDADYDD